MRHFSFLLVCCLISYAGIPCSCIPLGRIDDRQYDEYQLIIKGKVLKTGLDWYGKRYLIKVEYRYKGIIFADTVSISSPQTEGMCGISAKVGKRWLFFATKQKGFFITNLCTRTKTVETKDINYNKEEVEADLVFLENKVKMDCTNFLYPFIYFKM